jgi:deoxyribonuclease-4
MATVLRVRQVLASLDAKQKQALLKLLPVSTTVPVVETGAYPSALLGSFPKAESYAILGCVAEALLRLPSSKISLDALFLAIRHYLPTFSAAAETKIRASKTTEPFLSRIISTRMGLESVVRLEEGALRVEETIGGDTVVGHPDLRNNTQIFEIKLTGQLDKNWKDFLLQVFAYGALAEEATDLFLVLPLQTFLWHAEIGDWEEREAFKDLLVGYAEGLMAPSNFEAQMMAAMLLMMYRIGHHAKKEGTLVKTIANFQDYSRPYQIFLSGPQNSNMKISDGDLAAASALVLKNKAQVYVHSQYILNLCGVKEGDDWQVDVLRKNLQYTRAFGGKGVVVHVGKSVKMPIAEALETMRKAITKCLDAAHKDCPLLLETPAGQGTETLTDMKEFLDFVESFHDDRLRMCLDTCHVFACGHKPVDYIQSALSRPGLLKLIHYNDSLGDCGSCVDRHGPIGLGKIGIETMTEIAALCSSAGLPMVIE